MLACGSFEKAYSLLVHEAFLECCNFSAVLLAESVRVSGGTIGLARAQREYLVNRLGDLNDLFQLWGESLAVDKDRIRVEIEARILVIRRVYQYFPGEQPGIVWKLAGIFLPLGNEDRVDRLEELAEVYYYLNERLLTMEQALGDLVSKFKKKGAKK